MLPLSPSQLVRVWERGAGQPAMLRALTMLAEAEADAETEALLLDLPLGARDDRLLARRGATFGSRLEALATCPGCGERVELRFSTADVSGTADGLSSSRNADAALRPLTTRDLMQVSASRCKSIAEARR